MEQRKNDNMKNTLIIYQYPDARIDIIRWANEQKLNGFENEYEDFWFVEKEKENITIFPSNKINNTTYFEEGEYDKVVLWGSFKKSELNDIQKFVRGDW